MSSHTSGNPVDGNVVVGIGVTVATPLPESGVIVNKGVGVDVEIDVDVAEATGVFVAVGAVERVNVAVIDLFPFIVMVTGFAELVTSPDQPLNTEPAFAVAVNVTTVPAGY
jgi:hypothetical protein